MHRSAGYYAKLAHACDAVLQAASLEKNALYQVSITESGLPKVITDLHPACLWLSWDSVTIDFGHGAQGFWVGWGPDRASTNLWTLQANVQGSRETVYAEVREE